MKKKNIFTLFYVFNGFWNILEKKIDKSLLGAGAFKNVLTYRVEIDKKFVSIGNWDFPLDSTGAVFFGGAV